MTAFSKEAFTFDGMYLMYEGPFEGAQAYGEAVGADRCHPSRVDMQKPAFIARFKHGRKNWKTWVNFLVKNFTVEEYIALAEATSPVQAMASKGFKKI